MNVRELVKDERVLGAQLYCGQLPGIPQTSSDPAIAPECLVISLLHSSGIARL
jgi:hypothetical protein